MSARQPQLAPIGGLIEKVATWNPVRDAPEDELAYIDLSAVDNTKKAVASIQLVLGRDAPSRARQLVKSGDILISTVRPNLNGVARVPEKFDGATASTGFCVLRPSPSRLDGGYLFHWVRTSQFVADMVRKATGASYPAVSDKIIAKSEIPLPRLEEQKRIAAILDQADELRCKRQSTLDRLNLLSQATFIEMFGDPRTGPSDWELISFADACEDQTSRSEKLQRSDYQASGAFPVVDQGQSFVAGYSDDVDLICRSKNPVVIFGDHTRAVKYVDFPFVIGADGAKVLVPSHRFQPRYFAELLRLMPVPDLGYSRHMREVKRLLFPCPPIEAQNRFAAKVAEISAQNRTFSFAVEGGKRLFGSLQYRAFRGEL